MANRFTTKFSEEMLQYSFLTHTRYSSKFFCPKLNMEWLWHNQVLTLIQFRQKVKANEMPALTVHYPPHRTNLKMLEKCKQLSWWGKHYFESKATISFKEFPLAILPSLNKEDKFQLRLHFATWKCKSVLKGINLFNKNNEIYSNLHA